MEYFETPAVVLGLYVNGIGTIRSLAEDKRIRILGVGGKNEIGLFSKYLYKSYPINDISNNLEILKILKAIIREYGTAVLFPTGTDFWVKFLVDYAEQFKSLRIFYNKESLDIMRKYTQVQKAIELGIPCPLTREIHSKEQLEAASRELNPPFVVKPIVRNAKKERFRIKVLENRKLLRDFISPLINEGEEYIVSEMIPGDDSNLYTYGSYAYKGKVIREFYGRKLTQIPSNFGCVGTAEAVEKKIEIEQQSKELIKAINFTGISQIEYKYDNRTKEYKLIEINPRSWMWVYLSTKCGINLPLSQYYFETGKKDLLDNIGDRYKRHKFFVYGNSIFYNIFKEGRFRSTGILLKSLFSGKTVFAIFSLRDPQPTFKNLANILLLVKRLSARILKKDYKRSSYT